MPQKYFHIALCLVWTLLSSASLAQNVVSDRIVPDTVYMQKHYERSNQFYERLKEGADDSRFYKKMYRAFVSEDVRHRNYKLIEPTLEKEINAYKQFEGRQINTITIVRHDVFRDDYPPGDFRTLANSVHIITQENKIRRNLLFKEGDLLSPSLFAQNEQLLRSLKYLSKADIIVFDSENNDGVDVYVITRDSWSIGFTIHSAPLSRKYLRLYDSNVAGTGNKLGLRTYTNYKGDKYGGNMVEYSSQNLLGTFFEIDVLLGKGYEEHTNSVKLSKEFIRQSDFMLGGRVEDRQYYERQMMADTMLLNRFRNYDIWAGKSWAFPAVKSSFYLSARYQDLDFMERPEVKRDSNTYYHSHRSAILSTGIYRETYYKGNMIYGYGATENIPYGHKFELTGGRYWGEFNKNWYTAFTSTIGRQAHAGYIRGEMTLSTFWDEKLNPSRSAFALNVDMFSNLWRIRRNYVRQFLSVRYLNGFNRFYGEGEQVTFRSDAGLGGLKRDHEIGNVRFVVNTETVMFTPIYFYGFRFVFFGFADLGTLGNHNNPFNNDCYTAFGLGVRLKNERLIFNSIQIRLGFALKNGGTADYRRFRFSGQRHFRAPQFKPNNPDYFNFR